MKWIRVGGLAVFLTAATAFADDTDPIRAKVNIARTAYKVEHQGYREAVSQFFDKREEAARAEGNKKAVDQIKAERTAFESSGTLPKSMPTEIQKKFAAARAAMEEAFVNAVKEATRLRKDDVAAAIENELKLFRSDSGAPWVPLFNGTDTRGWYNCAGSQGKWQVVNGVLIGTGGEGYLVSNRKDFQNFRLRVEVRLDSGANSGVFFRSAIPKVQSPQGYEAELTESLAGSLLVAAPNPADRDLAMARKGVPAKTWFMVEVLAQGNHFTIWLDGQQVVDFVDTKNRHSRGGIALQKPFASKTEVQFRRIEIKELPGK